MLFFVCAALLVFSLVQAQSLESRQGSTGLCFPGPNHKRNLAVLEVTSPSELEGEGLLTLVNVLKDTIRGVEKNENSIQMMLQNMAQIFSPEEKREICDVQDCEGQNEKPTNPLEPGNPRPSDNSGSNDPKSQSDNPDPRDPSPSDNPEPNDPTATLPPDNSSPNDETPTAPSDPLDPHGSGGDLQEEKTTQPGEIIPPLEDDIFIIVETKDKPKQDLDLQNVEVLKSTSLEDISTAISSRKLPKTDTEVINNVRDVESPEDMFIIVETIDNRINIINQTHLININKSKTNQENEILNDQEDAFIIVETDDKEYQNQTEKSLLENVSIKNESDIATEKESDDAFVIVETGEKLNATNHEQNKAEYLEQSKSRVVTSKIEKVTGKEKEQKDEFVIVETDEKLNVTRNEREEPKDDFLIVETDEKLNATRNETKEPKDDFIIVETDEKVNETEYLEVEQNETKTVTNDEIDPLNIVENIKDIRHQKKHDHRKIIKIPGKAYVIVETIDEDILTNKDDKEISTNKAVGERNTERKESAFSALKGGEEKSTRDLDEYETTGHLIVDTRDEKQKQLDLNILRLKYLQRRLEQPARLNKKLKIIRTAEGNGRLRNDEAVPASQARHEVLGRAQDRLQYARDFTKVAYPSQLQSRLGRNQVPRKRHKIIRTKSIPEGTGEQRIGTKKTDFNAPYRNGYSNIWQRMALGQ